MALSCSFTPFPLITTERLLLRKLHIDDDKALFLLRSDEKVNRYIDSPRLQSVAEAQQLIHKLNSGIDRNEWVFWVISLRETHEVAGTICLWNINEEQYKAETGYMLYPHAQGKGLMHEALSAVIDYGFTMMKLKAIEAYTHKDNNRSTTLLVRNFFVKQGEPDASMNLVFTLNKT